MTTSYPAWRRIYDEAEFKRAWHYASVSHQLQLLQRIKAAEVADKYASRPAQLTPTRFSKHRGGRAM